MAESPNHRIKITPCKGRCGRMTRNSHHRIEDFPGTVSRHRGGKCQFCWKNENPDATPPMPQSEKLAGLAPCKGSCGRMTRHSGMRMEDYPGTVTRHRDERCQYCITHGDDAGPPQKALRRTPPKPYRKRKDKEVSRVGEVPDEQIQHVAAELDAYTRARNARLARQERAAINQQMLRFRGTGTPVRSAV